MKQQKFIFVTFQKEGIHCYPDAPEGVEFLRNDHRHVFHFRVDIEVWHNDRDIEFILFKRELESLYGDDILKLNYQSCEMMGNDLAAYLQETYPGRDLKVEVSEDGENGAVLYYPSEDEQIPRLFERSDDAR